MPVQSFLKKTSKSRLGIVTTGKSYSDTIQALVELGISEANADDMGLCLFKIGMPWPLEPTGIEAFAQDLDEIIVIEEKRGLIEEQLRSILYNHPQRPLVLGKKDEDGATLFSSAGALDPVIIGSVIAQRLAATDENIASALSQARSSLTEKMLPKLTVSDTMRTPFFCAGCPHSTSTKLPVGTRGYAGIGCHYMSQFMHRGVDGYTHMGG